MCVASFCRRQLVWSECGVARGVAERAELHVEWCAVHAVRATSSELADACGWHLLWRDEGAASWVWPAWRPSRAAVQVWPSLMCHGDFSYRWACNTFATHNAETRRETVISCLNLFQCRTKTESFLRENDFVEANSLEKIRLETEKNQAESQNANWQAKK